jgi:membrane protein YqaA with SNARE-associated domain
MDPRGAAERRAAFARSRHAVALAFAWGAAEAVVFPIVPDVGVAAMSLAAPGRFAALGLAATAGSVAGSAVSYWLGAAGASGVVGHVPLVTGRMVDAAAGWMHGAGAWGLWHQPWSGVPIKVFAFQAAGQGVPFPAFLGMTLLVRGSRILAVAGIFAAVGRAAGPWLSRWYGLVVGLLLGLFTLGLVGVVRSWS